MDIEKQVEIKSASYRLVEMTPGHSTYGVWINGAKTGELIVRNDEIIGFEALLDRAFQDILPK